MSKDKQLVDEVSERIKKFKKTILEVQHRKVEPKRKVFNIHFLELYSGSYDIEEKRIIIKAELVTEDNKIPIGAENVIAIPTNNQYSFYYFDNKKIEELIIKNIEMVSVEMVLLEKKEEEEKEVEEKV